MEHKVVIPFLRFGKTNWYRLQGSRCPRRMHLESWQSSTTWCLLYDWLLL